MKNILLAIALVAFSSGAFATCPGGVCAGGYGATHGGAISGAASGAISGAVNLGSGRSVQSADSFGENVSGAHGYSTPNGVDLDTYSYTWTGASVRGNNHRALGGGAALGAAGGVATAYGHFGNSAFGRQSPVPTGSQD